MDFRPHVLLPDAFIAFKGKYSFLVLHDELGWTTSWQDQENGGSASNTIEGPFASRKEAEANCVRIYNLLRKKH